MSSRAFAQALEPRKLMSGNPFTPGDIVVYRVGTGASLGSSATAAFLDEYTPSGALVQSIALPASGAVELTAGGTSATEGQMTLSPDGSTIALTGYDVAAGGVTQGTDNGTVALVGASADPAYYVLPSASVVNGNNIRTATVDGNKLYIAGAATYIQYANVSALTSGGAVNAATTGLSSTTKNIQELQIFDGQLYFSTQKQSGYGISGDSVASLGSGEPTNTSTPAGVADTSNNSSSFFFEHLGGGTGAPNTLYVADNSNGVVKYSLVSGTWTAEGELAISGGAVGITGSVDSSGDVHIFATNSAGIYTITDTSGQAGTLNGNAARIATAVTGTAIDGIVLAPDDGVGAITGLGGTTSYTQGTPAISPAKSAAFTDASNFDGGKLVVSGGLANDTLGIASAGAITVSGSAVSCNGTQVGVFSGGTGTTALTITFNNVGGNPVNSAAVAATIDAITFSSSTASAVGNRTLKFQVTENSGATDTPATQTVNVAAPSADAPLINTPSNLNIAPNANQQSITLTGIQHNGGSGSIAVTASSDAPSIIANTGMGAVAIAYNSPNTTGTLTFTAAAGSSGTAHITITVTDSGGSTVVIETVNVTGPPINSVPGGLSVVENGSLGFSSASNDSISIADFAVGANAMQVALSVSHGSLTFSSTAGLTFTSGGNGRGSLTVSGTLTNLNAALANLSYSPTAGYAGTDALQLTSSDLGNTALGVVQSATSTVVLSIAAAPPVLINEIEANEPGTTDDRYEYVELSGTPGATLNNIYFAAFDGSAGTTGNADLVVNLSGYSLGSDGLLVIQSSAAAGHSIPNATTLVTDPAFFTVTGGFPNGTLSFFLFDSPNAAFVQGTDYDTNDDGTLDHLPIGAAAIDNVAIPDTNDPDDIIYGNVEVTEIGSLNKGTADAVTRFPNITAISSGAWYGGELVDTNNLDSQIDYDSTRESANEPANAYLTPGAVNYPQPPVFSPASYSFSVPKTAGPGTAVGSVTATAAGTDTLTYSLSGSGSSNFVISSSSGLIIVASGAILSSTSYSLTATAKDNQDGQSVTATVTINLSTIPTTIGLNSTSANIAYGQPVTFTATVTPASGSGETGTVQFIIDGNAENPMALTGGSASFTTSNLDAGSHSIQAVYSGDSNFSPSTSSTLNQTVTTATLNLSGPVFYLKLDGDGADLDIWTNTSGTGAFTRQLLSNMKSVAVAGTSGADTLLVDFSAGDPLPAGGLTDTGGGNGADQLLVIGSGGDDVVTASAGQIVVNGAVINSTHVAAATFTPGPGVDSLTVDSGTLALAPPAGSTGITAMTFSSISLMAGATLMVDSPAVSADRSVLVASSLTLSQSSGNYSSTLDLSANDLVVRGGNLAVIQSEVNSGLSLGVGITSSTAVGNVAHLTTLGVIQNTVDGSTNGAALYASGTVLGGFDGVDTVNTDVLVKYTYCGDTNLDGKADGSDYSRMDNGALNHLTGWYNGDLNYDGSINGSDYTLMDNAFNMQGASLAVAVAEPHGNSRLKGKDNVIANQNYPAASLFQTESPIVFSSPEVSVEELMRRKDVLSDLIFATE